MRNVRKLSDPEIVNNFQNVYSPSDDTYLILDYFKENINYSYFDGLKIEKINNILDVGTGTGIIAIFFLLIKKLYTNFNPKIYASDILEEAIHCSKLNEKDNHFKKEIRFIKSDLFESFPESLKYQFNIIVFNPPYLPSIERYIDKKEAIDVSWDGGLKGIEILKRFLKQVSGFIDLKRKSYIYFISSSRAEIKELDNYIRDQGFRKKLISKKHFFFEDIFLNRLELVL